MSQIDENDVKKKIAEIGEKVGSFEKFKELISEVEKVNSADNLSGNCHPIRICPDLRQA